MRASKFLVIGAGQFGAAIASKLADRGSEVYAFDNNEEKIETIKDDVALAVTLDSTDKKTLKAQQVDAVDAVVVAIGKNFEAVILTTVHLMELGAKRIIVRASGPQQIKILQALGVEEILTPEFEVATVVAEKLINPSVLSSLQLPDDHEIAEIKAPVDVIGRTIGDIDLPHKYELSLITIKREFEGEIVDGERQMEQHVMGVPTHDMKIESTDTLVVFGLMRNVTKFIEINT